MKFCRTCGIEKTKEAFGTHKATKDKLQSSCKHCINEKTKQWKAQNPEQYKKYKQKWRQENKTSVNISTAKRRKRLTKCLWDQELTDFVTEEAHHLRLLRNTLTNTNWHVDHIIPLKGKSVCGLHVWNNLQVIPAKINLQKHNTFLEYEE